MRIEDKGIIISIKKLKESYSIVTILSENNGLYSGVTRVNSKKKTSLVQEGNLVDFTWYARLDQHIGSIKLELVKSYNYFIINNKKNLYAFNSIVSIIKLVFIERDKNDELFGYFLEFVRSLKNELCFLKYISLEILILSISGYRLQLEKCAVTGEDANLFYVSPKSGKAVSKDVGKPYISKLLILPDFLKPNYNYNNKLTKKDIIDSINLTSYFFNRYLFNNFKFPKERDIFIELIKKYC